MIKFNQGNLDLSWKKHLALSSFRFLLKLWNIKVIYDFDIFTNLTLFCTSQWTGKSVFTWTKKNFKFIYNNCFWHEKSENSADDIKGYQEHNCIRFSISSTPFFSSNNARMQVHISLTHIHFTLPNDCFYIAPFSVRKTQVYVCTNQCDRSRACPQYRACVPLFMPGLG